MSEPAPPRRRGPVARVLAELGLTTLASCAADIHLLMAQRFTRLFAYGASTLILVSYLESLGHDRAQSGLFMTLTLVGDIAISFLLTLTADRVGRRTTLAVGAALMALSGVVFALFRNYWVLLAAAVFGVISPSGNEIGPFRAVEESIVAHLTTHEQRSDVYAWYSLLGTAGTAFGIMACGWAAHALVRAGWELGEAYRLVFWGSWMTFYFRSRFGIEEGRLGSIFFTTSLISAASVIVASSISKRLGNVKTMVFTHLPSSVFLALIPLPSNVSLSLALLALRACTQSMDVAPRSAFLAAILLPSERTAVMGLVNVVKTSAQSMGPLITGVLANHDLFWVSFERERRRARDEETR
ncbi:MFS transporter [Metarhizium acridum CQMa 102]|uniref:MFS transporter n=1 Tax=Metarhizium acridum (strain CQMa 102) TaxID=655827 RepID=E9DRB6_METAQ|nr:MFS transporter [Metarhizium acridum CQMa 102]EFY93794.1 MFS transporter [Metarhizium acridum CQMa 102]